MKTNRYVILIMASFPFLIAVSAHAHDRGYYRRGYPIVRHYDGRPAFRFYFGYPFYWPQYYYPPYYYPPYYFPPAYSAPEPPLNYVQPGVPSQTHVLNPNVWNYCHDPEGYYPQVSLCPGGWQEIQQQPAGQEPGFWYYCNNPAGYYPYVRNCSDIWQKINPDGGHIK